MVRARSWHLEDREILLIAIFSDLRGAVRNPESSVSWRSYGADCCLHTKGSEWGEKVIYEPECRLTGMRIPAEAAIRVADVGRDHRTRKSEYPELWRHRTRSGGPEALQSPGPLRSMSPRHS